MRIKEFPKIDTTRLLQLTSTLDEKERQELLEYVGLLENREKALVQQINWFIGNVVQRTGKEFEDA